MGTFGVGVFYVYYFIGFSLETPRFSSIALYQCVLGRAEGPLCYVIVNSMLKWRARIRHDQKRLESLDPRRVLPR